MQPGEGGNVAEASEAPGSSALDAYLEGVSGVVTEEPSGGEEKSL